MLSATEKVFQQERGTSARWSQAKALIAMGSENEGAAEEVSGTRKSEVERHSIRTQRESLLSPPSPEPVCNASELASGMKVQQAPSPIAQREIAQQKDEKDKELSRASTAAKDALRPLRLRNPSVGDTLKDSNSALASPPRTATPGKDAFVVRGSTASESRVCFHFQ